MTTMPPEMSTATATPTVALSASPNGVQRESLSSLQSSRSRFMITDILAGRQAAAAAALSAHGAPDSPGPGHPQHPHHQHGQQQQAQSQSQQQQHHHPQQQQHHHHHHHQLQQQHAALQHYLAQQQHLLQQQHFQGAGAHPQPASPHQHQHHHPQAAPQLQHLSHHPHASALAHLPTAALIGFPGGGAGNGHYAVALQREQQERERLRELDACVAAGVGGGAGSVGSGGAGGRDGGSLVLKDHGEAGAGPGRDLSSGAHNTTTGGSSISGDQASTIDDSDSDGGGKDDDGNSIKSDNLMGLSKKQRKARTAFTDHQLQTLEKSFERQKYLSVQDRMELANKLELSDCQVKTWYQNRRTKWKRQTAVGLELLAEAGNYAAFQRLYGGGSPYLSAWPYAAQSPHGAPPSAIDLYYRQAAAAAALQKPLSYRMYPGVPPMGGLAGMPVAPSPIAHLSASNSLSSLSSYYQTSGVGVGVQPPLHGGGGNNNGPSAHGHSPVRSEFGEKRPHSADLARTPSPQLNPGSPPERADNNSSCPPPSDEDVEREHDAAEADGEEDADNDDDDDEDAIEV